MAGGTPPLTFEELELPLAVTATELLTGRQVYLSGGNLYAALGPRPPTPARRQGRRLWHSEGHLGTVQALRRAVDIMQAQLTDARLRLSRPDVLLRPQLAGVDFQNFRRGGQAIQAGEAAALAELPRLRALAS